MQWTAGPGAGFSESEPWIPAHPNHTWINAESQRGSPSSVYEFYRVLLALRHSVPVIVRGDFRLLGVDAETVYAFRRGLDDQAVEVFANLSSDPVELTGLNLGLDGVLVGNYPAGRRRAAALGPWEARAYRR
jgi:oligo-1,6-glucosidase